MVSIQILKRLSQQDVDGKVLEELVLLSASARLLYGEYMALGADVPEWLNDGKRILEREIQLRTSDEVQRRLRELDAEERGLESRDEKRQRIQRERDALQRKAGMIPVPAAPSPASTT